MHVNVAKCVVIIKQSKLILPEGVSRKVAALLFRIVIPARHENMRSLDGWCCTRSSSSMHAVSVHPGETRVLYDSHAIKRHVPVSARRC
jgi:hypothetical protein